MPPLIVATLLLAATLAVCAQRPVDRYSVTWGTGSPARVPLGRPAPPDGPYAGNGDITVMYTGSAPPPQQAGQGFQQWLYLSKNDLWSSDSAGYYTHLSAGRVGLLLTPPGASGLSANGSVTMYPGNASISHTLTAAGGLAVSGVSRVLENNVVATTLLCTSPGSSGSACNLTLLLSDTDANHYGVPQSAGAAPDGSLVWWRKENLHSALNPAYIGSCDPTLPLQSIVRAFAIEPATGALSLANGSCLWSNEQASPGMVTVGECAGPHGAWVWKGPPTAGDIELTASAQCLTASSKGLGLGPCGAAPWAQLPAGEGAAPSLVFIGNATSSAAQPGCIVAVPDNNNNTLGVALGLADASGALVKGVAARVSPTDASAGMTLTLTLQPGTPYTLLTALQTLRDTGCAGIRPQWEQCTVAPQDAASALVTALAAPAALAAALSDSEAFWQGYWGASSVDIASGSPAGTPAAASAAAVERWYYLHQYLLACTTRDGKVTPALDGFVCIEPVPWDDQFTLDYNLEATYWGAASSNRLAFMHPVMASATNPGAVATARLRAQSPGAWGRNPNWHSAVGRTVVGAVCQPDGCPNLTTTGFQGTEWPSAGMPLGDMRLADSDLQTRFIGGLLATNLIQYYEHSRNVSVLESVVYPFVRDNALFYLSYATVGGDGKLLFPYTCAQEACECRDAEFIKNNNVPVPNATTACEFPDAPFKERCPDAAGWELNHPCLLCESNISTGSAFGNHNAHPDLAFAASSFRNAARFAALLGVDAPLAAQWLAALGRMPDYPSADFTFVPGVPGSEFNGGAGFFVEAMYGKEPGMAAPGGSATPPTWPWCNKEYPIANFAAMWPTDEIGSTQTEDAALLARAKQTVYGLNAYTAKPWANVNGFCLSWPPAVRVSGAEDALTLLTAFAAAIASTTGHNACVENHGGMLENIGATVAINDMLLQSHGGRARFFPVWNASALGGASFTTLRAYGAFLVSAAMDQAGTVAPVALASEVGGDFVFQSPWAAGAQATDSSGASVPLTTVSQGVFSLPTAAGMAYTLKSS